MPPWWHARSGIVSSATSEFTEIDATLHPDSFTEEPSEEPTESVISPAQLSANRANAQHSTGPRTSEGKAKSSLNAVKSALTGRTVLLPTDDAPSYRRHILAFENDLKPVGLQECELVQSIADTGWRLHRIFALEMAIFAKGEIECAALHADQPPSERSSLADLHTFLTYEKQLRNLQLQESRLARRRDKDLAELRRLQQERGQKERRDLREAADLYTAAQRDRKPFDPAAFGFEFSIAAIERHLAANRAAANGSKTSSQAA